MKTERMHPFSVIDRLIKYNQNPSETVYCDRIDLHFCHGANGPLPPLPGVPGDEPDTACQSGL